MSFDELNLGPNLRQNQIIIGVLPKNTSQTQNGHNKHPNNDNKRIQQGKFMFELKLLKLDLDRLNIGANAFKGRLSCIQLACRCVPDD